MSGKPRKICFCDFEGQECCGKSDGNICVDGQMMESGEKADGFCGNGDAGVFIPHDVAVDLARAIQELIKRRPRNRSDGVAMSALKGSVDSYLDLFELGDDTRLAVEMKGRQVGKSSKHKLWVKGKGKAPSF